MKNADALNSLTLIASILSTKGGVVKTTGTANPGGWLADRGLKVLMIDADIRQPTLSSYYPLDNEAPGGIYELIAQNELDPATIISHTAIAGLDIIISNDPRGELMRLLQAAPGSGAMNNKLTSMIVTLEQLRPYDLNPRLMRNPNYGDIKASIRHRGRHHYISGSVHAAESAVSFDNLFSSALSLFNDQPEDFAIEQVQDELLALMSQQLNVDYNLLLLDVDPSEQQRQAALGTTPEPPLYIPPEKTEPRPVMRRRKPDTEEDHSETPVPQSEPQEAPSLSCEGAEPVTDIWRIPQLFDTTESLRSVSDRLAWDLAEHYAIDDRVLSDADGNGIGFRVMPFTSDHPMFARPQSRACWPHSTRSR